MMHGPFSVTAKLSMRAAIGSLTVAVGDGSPGQEAHPAKQVASFSEIARSQADPHPLHVPT